MEERQGPTVEDVRLYLIFEKFTPNSEKKKYIFFIIKSNIKI